MKVILALAVLCVAAQAAHLNISAYHLGFAENLGLNEAQIQHGFSCLNSFKSVLSATRDVVHNSEPARLLLNLLNLVEEAKEELKGTCQTYLQDLFATIYRKTNGADLKLIIGSNFNRYPLEVIQQVALWVRAMESGDMYHAGNIEASIIQILLGMQTPYVLETPAFNFSRYTEMNTTKYAREVSEGFFQTLGIRSDALINSNAECSISVLALVEKNQKMQYSLEGKTNVEKFHTILDFVQEASIAFQQCGEALKLNWRNIYVPLIEVFRNAPGHSFLHVVKNIALNAPELKHLKMQELADLLEGNYRAVGESEAKILLALVEGLF